MRSCVAIECFWYLQMRLFSSTHAQHLKLLSMLENCANLAKLKFLCKLFNMIMLGSLMRE